MSRFDIELLYVVDEIYKTRSVTRAADNLGLPHKYASAIRAGEMLPCPFSMPSFGVKQHWHERYHADLANRWLRSTFSALFAE